MGGGSGYHFDICYLQTVTWIQATRFILNICAYLRANRKVPYVNCIVWSLPNPIIFLVWGIREGFLEWIFSYFSLMLSHSPSPLVGPRPTLMSPFCHAGLIIQHSIFNLSLFPALQISLQLLSWWYQQSEPKNTATKHSFVFYFRWIGLVIVPNKRQCAR